MNKTFLIVLVSFVLLALAALILAIVLSFKVVRQTTDKINVSLISQLQPVVRVPTIIPPETRSFAKTIYVWEMETTQGEITKVRFSHDTLFDKNSPDFNATLEMEAGQDPSLFNKVLPAVIADKQVLVSLDKPEQINTGSNSDIGYEKLAVFEVEGRVGQIAKVSWVFPKSKIIDENSSLYQSIYNYPVPITRSLYSLQRFIIDIFSGS